MARDFQHDCLGNCFVRDANKPCWQDASMYVGYLVTDRLVAGRGRDTTLGASRQLLSLLRIHGQHGNAVYKGSQ